MSAHFFRLPQSNTLFVHWRYVKGFRRTNKYTVPHRCIHVARTQQLLRARPSGNVFVQLDSVTPLSTAMVRWNSSQNSDFPAGYIPDPPPVSIPDPEMSSFIEEVNSLGEPTLQSLGLGAFSPAGIIQQSLEWFHVALDVPWWGAICIATVILRICISPIIVMAMKNSTHFANHMPEYRRMIEKKKDADRYGDHYESMRLDSTMREYSAKHNLKLWRMLLVPMVQAPIFISVFSGFRGMVYLPVDSMKTGGLFWFTDLTVPDPFCILPILTASTMLLQLELGSEMAKSADLGIGMRWVMRGMPLMVLFVTWKFPAAMLCYWFTSNTFSLIQGIFLRTPAVAKLLNMPKRISQPASSSDNMSIMDKYKSEVSFRKAEKVTKNQRSSFKQHGDGPRVKTYPYDPTKVKKRQAQK